MPQNVVPILVAGLVALAFLFLVGFLVWRLTATVPKRVAGVLVAVATLLAGLPPVLYALLSFPT